MGKERCACLDAVITRKEKKNVGLFAGRRAVGFETETRPTYFPAIFISSFARFLFLTSR